MFAYGTLQAGLAPTAIRSAADRLSHVDAGSAAGFVYDLGSYPGARFDRDGVVHGTVYQLPVGSELAVLAAFDAYEGVPDLYVRVTVPVTLTDGRLLDCWAYQYNHELAGRLPIRSGRYVREHRP